MYRVTHNLESYRSLTSKHKSGFSIDSIYLNGTIALQSAKNRTQGNVSACTLHQSDTHSEITCEMSDSRTRDLTASSRSSQVQWTRWYSIVGTCSRKLATSRILFFSFSPLYETQIGTSERVGASGVTFIEGNESHLILKYRVDHHVVP